MLMSSCRAAVTDVMSGWLFDAVTQLVSVQRWCEDFSASVIVELSLIV